MAQTKKPNRRGAPDAIAKRRAARALNQLFSASKAAPTIDKRTLKRKKRLIDELKQGKGGEPLKALDVLGHVTELLTLGETLPSIRKLKPKLPPSPSVENGEAALLAEVQALYGFDTRAWKVLGVDIEKIGASPAAEKADKPRRGRASRTAKKKASRPKSRTRAPE